MILHHRNFPRFSFLILNKVPSSYHEIVKITGDGVFEMLKGKSDLQDLSICGISVDVMQLANALSAHPKLRSVRWPSGLTELLHLC
jgi:hypothetical protein